MTSVQNKITQIVEKYIRTYPEEFDVVKQIIKQKRDNQKNRTGDMTKQTDTLIRPLYEIPETLMFLLQLNLKPDEVEYLRTAKGGQWFAKKFNHFRLVEKI